MPILENSYFLNESMIKDFLNYMGIRCVDIKPMSRTAVLRRLGISNYYQITTATGALLAIDKYYVYSLINQGELEQKAVNKQYSHIWREIVRQFLMNEDILQNTDFANQYVEGFQITKEHTYRSGQTKIATMQAELDDMMKENF